MVAFTSFYARIVKNVGKGAPMACAMIYWGKNYHQFYKVFIAHGAVIDLSNLIGEQIGAERMATTLFTFPPAKSFFIDKPIYA